MGRTLIVPIPSELIHSVQEVVSAFFWQPEEYPIWEAGRYHSLVSMAQGALRAQRMGDMLADSVRAYLPPAYTLGGLYLRAARPNAEGQESVGWHREEFYGSPRGTLNFWMPVMGVTRENTIMVIPGSDAIPDHELVIEQAPDPVVTKGSAGNEIGLLYAPKHLVGGVDFSGAEPLVVPQGSSAIFSGSLIHGAAVNRGPDIRFSVDFRVYPEAQYRLQQAPVSA